MNDIVFEDKNEDIEFSKFYGTLQQVKEEEFEFSSCQVKIKEPSDS